MLPPIAIESASDPALGFKDLPGLGLGPEASVALHADPSVCSSTLTTCECSAGVATHSFPPDSDVSRATPPHSQVCVTRMQRLSRE